MLEITNLVKKYNENSSSEQIVLNDCFFKIEEGEKVIITGENGSGKTTLLKIVGLLDKNFYGKYLIDGNNIDNLSNRKIAELRNEMFGFIFQEYNLLEEETVYENIVIPLIYSKNTID
ncbi:cell division ATP-binding protein FtsE [Peptoniphilus indolicus ATCC 29427]|uniref:Cell division ATP-binding protein FtsE n=1 Tax=Peptoniphilus indolicus ATCC 29427 TaxID=997350 RepID=G4D6Z7_9FIRM|nr:ATP-binding cassette domain-containing protein [Peptoniphilus indolicus]EGY76324.1 cell division ATP-binding protein FtsE [Peptoniphilus indolicus ATCC 29427]